MRDEVEIGACDNVRDYRRASFQALEVEIQSTIPTTLTTIDPAPRFHNMDFALFTTLQRGVTPRARNEGLGPFKRVGGERGGNEWEEWDKGE